MHSNFMAQAFREAMSAIGLSDPNPAVGAIIVNLDGNIIGRGHTQAVGHDHAEIVAIKDACKRVGKEGIRGASLYVTLEPCCHYGRTKPCVHSIVEYRFKQVYIATIDSSPKVNGKGIQFLKEAGITVHLDTDKKWYWYRHFTLAAFFHREQTNLPATYLKWAQYRDGTIAPPNNISSGAITSLESRILMHRMRKKFRATLVTPGTILTDKPKLDTRLANRSLNTKKLVKQIQVQGPSGADTSFINNLLQHVKNVSYSNGAGHFRYFLLPQHNHLSLDEWDSFIALQESLQGDYLFFSQDEQQVDFLHKRRIPHCLLKSSDVFLELLHVIAKKGHNQVFIEAGPSYAQFLVNANLINSYIAFIKMKDNPWDDKQNIPHQGKPSRGFSLSRLLSDQEELIDYSNKCCVELITNEKIIFFNNNLTVPLTRHNTCEKS